MGAEGLPRGRPAPHDRLLPRVPLKPELTVVVPCRDEEGSVVRYPDELLAPLDALGLRWEAVIVDDGSRDGTAAAAEALAARRPEVRVVRLPANRGLGGALRAGFSAAEGEWIATIDADLTFRPASLGELLAEAKARDADLAAGSPFLRRGDLDAVPWARRLPSLLLNSLYRGLFGFALSAYTPVFRLYRAGPLRELPLESEGFEINAEIAALAMTRHWRVAEVPVPLGVRAAGVSKLARGRELSRHLRLIARLLASS
ncbi:MAG: glycosyltransferase family 2 protein [Elusimicrobia bacterium]|nr:glycosyltransferase family 2 protein [Elusimicrobiota bacterium]